MISSKNYTLLVLILLTLNMPKTSVAQHPIATPGTEGNLVVVSSGGPIIATFLGHSATFSNDLYLELDNAGLPSMDGDSGNDLFLFNNLSSPVGTQVEIGSFEPGVELVFRLRVTNSGDEFFTGPAIRNPDNEFHARVQGELEPNTSLVSFEDLFGGPFDFNDLSFSFSNTTFSVPEPKSFIVVGHDVNTLASLFAGPNEIQFAVNVARYITQGKPDSKLLLLGSLNDTSRDYSEEVKLGLEQHGFSVTIESDFTVPLDNFDGIFLSKGFPNSDFIDNENLIEFAQTGGGVYLAGGVGIGMDAVEEAGGWTTFLSNYGLLFETQYNGFDTNIPITNFHPIFENVAELACQNGSSIFQFDSNPRTQVVQNFEDQGVYAVVEISLLGDVNCDGMTDLLDVAEFIRLINMNEFNDKADINRDGIVNLLDVAPFVDLLTN